MVIDRRFDTEASLVDGDGEAVVPSIYLEDTDFVESGEAMNRMEARQNAPSLRADGPSRIPWQALRLPGARSSERTRTQSAKETLAALFTQFQTSDVRSSPYLYLVTANTWTKYITNMDAQDVGAELSAPISMEERASLFLFAEEWRTDVSHQRFRNRLIDSSSVNMTDEIQKGQLVYDVVTGVIQPMSRPGGMAGNVMYRLGMDILQSIRFRYYNFYSVNLLHRDEGSAIYEEFLSRYIPLEAHEVAIITEMSTGIAAQGRAYASQTTSPVTDAVQNFALMNRAVESYHIGDTRTARAAITLLLGAPISYNTSAGFSVNTDPLGRSYITTEGKVMAVRFKSGPTESKNQKTAPIKYVRTEGRNPDNSEFTLNASHIDKHGGTFDFKNKKSDLKGVTLIEVNGMNDATPKNYIRFGDNKIEVLPFAGHSATINDLKTIADSGRERGNQHQNRKRNTARNNPVRIGQGQHFYIQLIPKGKMSFASKDKKRFGSPKGARKGKGRGPKNPVVGTPGRDATGLADIFGGFEKAGYAAWKGTHKETGKKLPWMIQLPRKRGKKGGIVFKAAQVTKNGKTYKTIRPFTADKKIKAAWKKFTDYYGEPKHANDERFKTKFRIDRADRGPFYKRVEPALGKMSARAARRISKKFDEFGGPKIKL